MKNRLREFYAVTNTSVYLVSEERDPDGTPTVEKIALRSDSSIPVGGRLKYGHLVAVTPRGVFLYHEDFSPYSGPRDRPQRPEEVNTRYWGGSTSPVVGLFLNRPDAVGCLAWGSRQMHDPVWWSHTMMVVKAIGDDHPVFILSRHPGFVFVFGPER